VPRRWRKERSEEKPFRQTVQPVLGQFRTTLAKEATRTYGRGL